MHHAFQMSTWQAALFRTLGIQQRKNWMKISASIVYILIEAKVEKRCRINSQAREIYIMLNGKCLEKNKEG